MRAGVFYFTGTGNTEFVARELALALGPQNPAELFNIELLSAPPTAEFLGRFDLLIFGAPVYAFNAPRHFCGFLRSLPEGNRQRTVIFLNAGGDKWADIRYPTSILERKGYRVTNQALFVTPGNLIVRAIDPVSGEIEFSLLGWKYRQNAPELFGQCRREVQELAQAILASRRTLPRFGAAARACFVGFRWIFFTFACNLLKWHIHATRDCTLCGQCVTFCPTRNITIRKNRVRFGSACTVCFRCLNACPEQAIRFHRVFRFLDSDVPYLAPGWRPPSRADSAHSGGHPFPG